MTQPATSAGCGEVGRDGRLQPWFADVTRENPVEMVVVLDVLRDSSLLLIRNDSLYGELTNGVTTVLGSLNNEDRVRRERERERESIEYRGDGLGQEYMYTNILTV